MGAPLFGKIRGWKEACGDMLSKNHREAKILVVDDEKLVRMVISAKLKQAGYSCVALGDVESAVAVLKQDPKGFSAIITDIMMGEMDGFVFRDIVRGIAPKIPVFFLTALDPEEGSGFLKRILEDPISYYLPKAVSTETLLNRVRQVVASQPHLLHRTGTGLCPPGGAAGAR